VTAPRAAVALVLLLAGCPHRDRPAIEWKPVLEGDPRGLFLSAWGPAADEVWVVGGQQHQGVALVGSADAGFTQRALPEGTPLLDWVHGTGSDDVWVGGISGTLLHWNGTGWEDFSIATDAAIWGIYAKSPTEAYAVGGTSSWGGDRAVAFAWDGQSWAPMDLPAAARDAASLFKVTDAGDAVWMVGVDGLALRATGGQALVSVPTGYADDLVTVNAMGGPLIAVGGRGTGAVLEVEGDGLAVKAEARAGLEGVTVFSPTEALVTGENGFTGLYHIDTDVLDEVPAVTEDVLHGSFAASDGRLYAVGGNLFTAGSTFAGTMLSAPAPGE